MKTSPSKIQVLPVYSYKEFLLKQFNKVLFLLTEKKKIIKCANHKAGHTPSFSLVTIISKVNRSILHLNMNNESNGCQNCFSNQETMRGE